MVSRVVDLAFREEHELREGEEILGVQRAEEKYWNKESSSSQFHSKITS